MIKFKKTRIFFYLKKIVSEGEARIIKIITIKKLGIFWFVAPFKNNEFLSIEQEDINWPNRFLCFFGIKYKYLIN